MLPKSSAPTSGRPGLLELPEEVIGSVSFFFCLRTGIVRTGPALPLHDNTLLTIRTFRSALLPPRSEQPPDQQPPEEAEQPVQPWSRACKRRGGGSSAL
jgi:hypothetical protein